MIKTLQRVRIIFVLGLLSVLGNPASAQAVEYVCTPCGHPCDGKVQKKGGECPTCRMAMVPRETVKITDLTPAEFCARIAANPDAIILDVRSEGEFKGTTTSVETYGHFKKAININTNQLTMRISELKDFKNREILVYCSQSYRSPRAAYYLNMQGFSNVKNLTGGLSKAGAVLKSACYRDHFTAHEKK